MAQNGNLRCLRIGSQFSYLSRMSNSPIADARQRTGITQAQFAERVGVSLIAVKRWESGARQPATAHLITLGRVIGVDAGEVIAFVAERRKSLRSEGFQERPSV